jgi:hypothetical protein
MDFEVQVRGILKKGQRVTSSLDGDSLEDQLKLMSSRGFMINGDRSKSPVMRFLEDKTRELEERGGGRKDGGWKEDAK